MKYPIRLAVFLLIISVIILGISGCKKYEEDDYWFTLRTAKSRVLGKYQIVDLIVYRIGI
jgi:hypothetical protein